MSYFGYLALFLGIPIVVLGWLFWRDERRGVEVVAGLRNYRPLPVILALVIVAVVWTTPWDNYLVATKVWWYDINLVTGIVIGYVPIEEYTFFIVQPIFTGLWLVWLMRRSTNPQSPVSNSRPMRLISSILVLSLAIFFFLLLIFGAEQFNYLSLELSWAFIPIAFQLWFGADILWNQRTLIALGIIPTTLYLAATDAVAIQSGTWTISPTQSLDLLLGGILPIEEFIFFLITNTLCVFGMILVMSEQSQERVPRRFK